MALVTAQAGCAQALLWVRTPTVALALTLSATLEENACYCTLPDSLCLPSGMADSFHVPSLPSHLNAAEGGYPGIRRDVGPPPLKIHIHQRWVRSRLPERSRLRPLESTKASYQHYAECACLRLSSLQPPLKAASQSCLACHRSLCSLCPYLAPVSACPRPAPASAPALLQSQSPPGPARLSSTTPSDDQPASTLFSLFPIFPQLPSSGRRKRVPGSDCGKVDCES